jgi:hypothetical protein
LFLRARNVGWATLMATGSAVLTGSAGVVEAPLTGEAVTLPYVWPAVSVVPVVLMARSRMRDWERWSARRLALPHALPLVLVPALAGSVVVAAQPQAWTALLTLSLTLEASALVGCAVLGDWAWLLAAGVASLTVLRHSVVERVLISSSSGDRNGVVLGLAGAAYSGAVLLASGRPRWGEPSGDG